MLKKKNQTAMRMTKAIKMTKINMRRKRRMNPERRDPEERSVFISIYRYRFTKLSVNLSRVFTVIVYHVWKVR